MPKFLNKERNFFMNWSCSRIAYSYKTHSTSTLHITDKNTHKMRMCICTDLHILHTHMDIYALFSKTVPINQICKLVKINRKTPCGLRVHRFLSVFSAIAFFLQRDPFF